MPSAIFINRNFGFDFWPTGEHGPAAIISMVPSNSPEEFLQFAGRLCSSRRLQEDRIGGVGTINSVAVVSISGFRGATDPMARWIKTDRKKVRNSIKDAFDSGVDLVIVYEAKKLFPRETLRKAAELCAEAAWSSASVYTSDEVTNLRIASIRHSNQAKQSEFFDKVSSARRIMELLLAKSESSDGRDAEFFEFWGSNPEADERQLRALLMLVAHDMRENPYRY